MGVPEGLALELAPGLRVVWNDVNSSRSALSRGEVAEEWRLDGDLGKHSAVRVLTGATTTGALILLAGARPAGAEGHDSEQPRAVIVGPSGALQPMEESLLSTQLSGTGQVERVGLELYAEGDDYPVRGAGDAVGEAEDAGGTPPRERTVLDFRLDGERGTAVLDVVRA